MAVERSACSKPSIDIRAHSVVVVRIIAASHPESIFTGFTPFPQFFLLNRFGKACATRGELLESVKNRGNREVTRFRDLAWREL